MSVHIGFKLTFEILHKSLKLRILSLPRYQLQHRPMTLLTTELPVDDTSNDSEISVRAFRYIQVKVAGWRVEFHIYNFHVHHGFNQVKQAG